MFRPTILIIGSILAFVSNSLGQDETYKPLRRFNDPTVDHFRYQRGDGDPGFTGDLNFSLHIMTVPGRGGLNYDIKLDYTSGGGVDAAMNSSWVGLGWNLSVGEITMVPATYKRKLWDSYGPPHPEPNCLFRYGQVTASRDRFFLSLPNGNSVEIIKSENGWCPAKWSALNVSAVDKYADIRDYDPWRNTFQVFWSGGKDAGDPADNATEYQKFTVWGTDGTRYIYDHFLRKQLISENTNYQYEDNYTTCLTNKRNAANIDLRERNWYTYVIKLTAILGSDYVDGNGNDIPDDGGIDKGTWIRFVYSNKQ